MLRSKRFPTWLLSPSPFLSYIRHISLRVLPLSLSLFLVLSLPSALDAIDPPGTVSITRAFTHREAKVQDEMFGGRNAHRQTRRAIQFVTALFRLKPVSTFLPVDFSILNDH